MEEEPDYVSSKGWAEMIRKVYKAEDHRQDNRSPRADL
jgi:hypothetical protein